tara:strand:+ start:177 stop:308 length:132 start_codon:yes stop_codon:yes gene_type:complete
MGSLLAYKRKVYFKKDHLFYSLHGKPAMLAAQRIDFSPYISTV